MKERLEAIVSGHVQMVMYRDFVQRKARGLKLTGIVKNLPDGTVQVIAEGPREQLEILLKKLNQGSLLSHVEQVTLSWLLASNSFKKFIISYD